MTVRDGVSDQTIIAEWRARHGRSNVADTPRESWDDNPSHRLIGLSNQR